MLRKIVEQKKLEVTQLKRFFDINRFEEQLSTLQPTLPLVRRLIESERSMSVIAEVKKASPSKGIIRADFHPVEIAQAYERAGVDAMSVLTDELFFQGSRANLEMIRGNISHIPLLRKDFIIDPLQIYEARLMGADCILLIAAILDSLQLKEFTSLARDLGMDVLLEVHNRQELDQVLAVTEPTIIGINNRNLKTFETTLTTTEELIPCVPGHIPVVSESGIHTKEDVEFLRGIGVRAVLVGEYFMRQASIELAVQELVG